MTERPALSKGELEVARVLWELGSASVRRVHEALPAAREIDFTTVQTYLRRLETKGYAKAKLDGRPSASRHGHRAGRHRGHFPGRGDPQTMRPRLVLSESEETFRMGLHAQAMAIG